jgi:integrase
VPNCEPTRREPDAFGSWSEVEAIAEKLPPKFRAIPLVVCSSALRPEEWRALRWEDVNLERGELHVRRVLVDGVIRPYGKTDGSMRRVPLAAVAVAALRSMPTPLRSSELVFPGRGGAPIDLHAWRRNYWKPAVIRAGLPYRPPYAMRRTAISLWLAAGISLFEAAQYAGTSPEVIAKHYGRLTHDAFDRARTAMGRVTGVPAAIRAQSVN